MDYSVPQNKKITTIIRKGYNLILNQWSNSNINEEYNMKNEENQKKVFNFIYNTIN